MSDKKLSTEPEDPVDEVPEDSKPGQRESMIEDLATRRPWAGQEDEPETTVSAEGEEPAADPEPEPEPEPEPDGPSDDMMVTAVVDGVETPMTLGEMRRSVQIEATARKHLEEANVLLEQAKEHPNIGAEPEPEPAPAASEDIDYKALARSLQYDDEDTAAEALQQTVERLRQPAGAAVDEERLRADVLSDVQNQMEWSNAVARFGEEYSDLLADEHIAAITGQRINASMQQALWDSQNTGAARPPIWDIFKNNADGIREWVDGLRTPDAPEPKDPETVDVNIDEDQRAGRKAVHSASTPRPRSRPSGAPGQADTPPSKDASRRSAIEDMQRQRGQLNDEGQE